MRLTFKLTAGTLIAVALMLGINVWFRVHREADTFLSEMKRDHIMLSRAIRVDVINEWFDGGQPAAFQLIQRMNEERDQVNITGWTLAAVPDDVAFTLNEGREVQRIEHRERGDVLVTWSPIAPRGRLLASLQLEEGLHSVDDYIYATLTRTAAIAVVGLVVTSIIAWVFGFYAVGRPVQALVEKARRVARGDLDGDVVLDRSDELSLIGDELNAMSRSLKEARAAVEKETEARLRAVEQLRHADRLSTVGTLAAGIAHELGTPLNVVLGRAQLIAGGAADAKRQATIIDEQTKRIIRIVRQLLDFARATTPERDDADLAVLAASTVELLGPIAQEKGVILQLAADSDDAGLVAHVDEGQIQQAFTNLVMNAIQATPAGRSVIVAARRVIVADEGRVALEVVDEGPGISAEVKARLFSPFFTTKPAGEGTGLGLAVAWGIVRENGGSIDVDGADVADPSASAEAAAGKGARFRIVLPLLSTTSTREAA